MKQETNHIEPIPSKQIAHLDKNYQVVGWKCWNQKDGFHVELILNEKETAAPSFSYLIKELIIAPYRLTRYYFTGELR